MLYAIVGLLVVILDQAVKYWTAFHVDLESTGEVLIPGILSLVNVHNDGVAFGFLAGSNARITLIIITGVFLLAVVIALATNFISGRFARWCLVLVAAGGFSNCIDRVIYGYVQDMFKCELFNFPVFNVADIFISVFAILFALAVIFERKTVYDDDDYEDEYDEDYDEEDDYEDEEDLRPARKGRRARLSRRKARDYDDYDDEEDEEDEEPEPEPVKPARKSRKERAEEEYHAARRAAAEEPKPAEPKPAPEAEPRPAAKKAAQGEDPFAAWEQANARVAAQSAKQNAARGLPAGPAPAAKPEAKPAAKPAEPKPAPKAEPKPAAKKPAAPAEEEFSLEDILAEFK